MIALAFVGIVVVVAVLVLISAVRAALRGDLKDN